MRKIPLALFCVLAALPVFSQNAVPLDAGFAGSVKYFESRVENGAKVVVLNFSSHSPGLSEYITEELTAHFVNSGAFTVVDRSNLELLEREMAFQLSGEVSDETALSIGKKLGAELIVSGSVEPFGDIFRLRVRAIAVESAAIRGIYTANIQKDRFLTRLAETPGGAPASAAPSGSRESRAENAVPSSAVPAAGVSPGAGAGSGNTGSVSLPDYLLTR